MNKNAEKISPKHILIFGGTTEGRVLADTLTGMGHRVTVCVATDIGKEELLDNTDVEVLVGRKDCQQIKQLLIDEGYELCIDATHPYAVEATANIRKACQDAETKYLRLLRQDDYKEEHTKDIIVEDIESSESIIRVGNATDAARYLEATDGNILVTTGAKEIGKFATLDLKRVYARVLPTIMSIEACEKVGLEHKNIIAMFGPFSTEMNEVLIKEFNIKYLVTKNSGSKGGFMEKITAAANTGIKVVLIDRPVEQGYSMDQIMDMI